MENQKAFNVHRERDQRELREWLMERGVKGSSVHKIIHELNRCCLTIVDINVDAEDDEITAEANDGEMIEFNFSGDATAYGN